MFSLEVGIKYLRGKTSSDSLLQLLLTILLFCNAAEKTNITRKPQHSLTIKTVEPCHN